MLVCVLAAHGLDNGGMLTLEAVSVDVCVCVLVWALGGIYCVSADFCIMGNFTQNDIHLHVLMIACSPHDRCCGQP